MTLIEEKNNKIRSGDFLVLISTIFMIAYILLPIIRTLPTTIRLGLSGIAFLCFFLGVFISQNRNSTKILFMSLIIIMFDFVIYYSQWINYTDVFTKSYWLFLFWFPFLQALYYIKVDNYRITNIVKKFTNFCLIVTSMSTIIGLYIFPMASRTLAQPDNELVHQTYKLFNMSGYGFIYSLVIAIPIIITLYKSTRKKIYLVMLVLFYFCIFKAQFTIAILISLMLLPLLFINRINILIMGFFTTLGVLVFHFAKHYIANLMSIFSELANKIGLDFLGYRLNQIYYSIIADELYGGARVRFELYSQSLKAFLNNPISGNLFGSNHNVVIGGHSELLDLLGSSGLIGIIFLILIITIYKKYVLDKFKNISLRNSSNFMIFIFLIIGLINTLFVAREIGFMFFFFPCCMSKFINKESITVMNKTELMKKRVAPVNIRGVSFAKRHLNIRGGVK